MRYKAFWRRRLRLERCCKSTCVSIIPCVSIRQHTSAYVRIRQHTPAYASIR